MRKTYQIVTLALAAAFVVHDRATAQLAGATTVTDTSVAVSTQVVPIKAMPASAYVDDTARRDAFVASSGQVVPVGVFGL